MLFPFVLLLLSASFLVLACRALVNNRDFSNVSVVRETLDLTSTNASVLYIFNLRSISANMTTPLLQLGGPDTIIFLEKSRLELYDEERRAPVDADSCDADVFEDRDLRFFSNLGATMLLLEMNSLSTRQPVCPYLFKNARIQELAFLDFVRNRLYRNELSFLEIRNPSNRTVSLNSVVITLSLLRIYRSRLELEPWRSLVFEAVKFMNVKGVLSSFHADFFRRFSHLVKLFVELDNIGEFFHASDNAWLAGLFVQGPSFASKVAMADGLLYGRNVRIFYLAFTLDLMQSQYMFPDEDFCLFKHFPADKLIMSAVYVSANASAQNSDSPATSCTYRFLSQNNAMIVAALARSGSQPPDLATFSDIFLDECQFKRRLALCPNATLLADLAPIRRTAIFYMDIQYAFAWMEFIGPVVTFPIFSALGFVFNLIVILVIRSRKNKKEKLFEAKAFRFIEMNSAFNCIECLVYQMRLMGLCLGVNSIYCSDVHDSAFVFYAGVNNYYLSEVLKSCSIITGLLFSIQRYIEASKTKNRYFKRFAELGMKRMLLFVLVYGLLVAVPVCFDVNYASRTMETYDNPNRFYISIAEPVKQAYKYLYFTHFMLNDLVVLVVNFVVDCWLVRVIKSDLRQKLQNKKKNTSVGATAGAETHATAQSSLEQAKMKQEEKKKNAIERKANVMILLSVLIYVFCRLPELAGAFVFYYLYLLMGGTCNRFLLCYLAADFIEYMYMLSYIFNIFLYYKFNTYFYRGFRNFFGLKTVKQNM